jgi:hypothetical protein
MSFTNKREKNKRKLLKSSIRVKFQEQVIVFDFLETYSKFSSKNSLGSKNILLL